MNGWPTFFASALSVAAVCTADAESVSGTLPCGEGIQTGNFVAYEFKLDQPRRVELGMSSKEVDSYLHLIAVGGDGVDGFSLIKENDDGGNGLDSFMAVDLNPGTYQVLASSIDGAGGSFKLSARGFREGSPRLLQSGVGNLADARPVAEVPASGEFGQRPACSFKIAVPQGGRIQVDVLALLKMDAVLMLVDSKGDVLGVNDDWLASQHSRLIMDVSAGEYTAWVGDINEGARPAGEFLINTTFREISDEAKVGLRPAPETVAAWREWQRAGTEGIHRSWQGKKVPNFELAPVVGNRMVSLEDFRGRLVLLDFWQPWFDPCEQSMADLERLQRELGESHGLTVVGISSGDPDRVRGAVARQNTSYVQLHDPGGETTKDYQVTAIPRRVLVGPDGEAIVDVNGSQTYASLLNLIEAAAPATEEPAEPLIWRQLIEKLLR